MRRHRWNGMLSGAQAREIGFVTLGATCECTHFEGAHFYGDQCQARILSHGCLIPCPCDHFHERGTPRRCWGCKGPTEVPTNGTPAPVYCRRCSRPGERVIQQRLAAFDAKRERERYMGWL